MHADAEILLLTPACSCPPAGLWHHQVHQPGGCTGRHRQVARAGAGGTQPGRLPGQVRIIGQQGRESGVHGCYPDKDGADPFQMPFGAICTLDC